MLEQYPNPAKPLLWILKPTQRVTKNTPLNTHYLIIKQA